ncbi:Nucleic acid-binding OB-fold [Penicillium waksmanii]|uniref:Nucleic acid-binding OB-fold n=1 Tax=Penicillium waksmanii TaxID=69791 RepID=UPI00254813A8|nr:Nucleic acid-binding OB-fold [Penicillium waksmanii]KAJ5984594.1 Nucleic acid-binding OB-fold [Penicillium waksmanii]
MPIALLLAAIANASDMPSCATECMAIGIEDSPCTLTNTTCICADALLQANLTACVQMTCTVKDSLTTANTTSTMCHSPIRNKANVIIITNSVFGGEDIFVMFGLLFSVGMGILEFFMIDAGYGRDIWTISFSNITLILKYNWIVEMLYVGAITSIKMAFLNLYLHIFPNFGLRNAIYIVMGIVVAFFFAFFFGICFNCLPVSYIWTSWTGETKGSCLDFNAFGIACAVINIVLDVTVMALPLHEIMKLNLRPMKKVLVMLMFCTGFFITIVSIIRLKSVVTFAHTTNATYDYVPVAYWSLIESYTAVICVSMPAIRRLFNSLLYTCFGIQNTHQVKSETYDRSQGLQRPTRSKNLSIGGEYQGIL